MISCPSKAAPISFGLLYIYSFSIKPHHLHFQPVFEEVQALYIDTLSKLHSSHFKVIPPCEISRVGISPTGTCLRENEKDTIRGINKPGMILVELNLRFWFLRFFPKTCELHHFCTRSFAASLRENVFNSLFVFHLPNIGFSRSQFLESYLHSLIPTSPTTLDWMNLFV